MSARGKSAIPGGLRDIQLERGTARCAARIGGVPPDENAFKVDIVDELELVQTSFVIAAMILLLIAFAVLIRRLQQLRRRPLRLGVGVEDAEEEIGALESHLQMRLRRAAQTARAELAARAGGPPGRRGDRRVAARSSRPPRTRAPAASRTRPPPSSPPRCSPATP